MNIQIFRSLLHDDGTQARNRLHQLVSEIGRGLYFRCCAWIWAARSNSIPAEASSRSAVNLSSIERPWLSKNACTASASAEYSAAPSGVCRPIAGREALVHLAVDAAGMLGVGRELFVAAAQLEEVEHGVAVRGRPPRARGTDRSSWRPTLREPVGGVDAREPVLYPKAQEVRRPQLQPAPRLVASENCERSIVEGQRRLEFGTGDGVLDASDATAQVQALALRYRSVRCRLRRREHACDAAAQIGGARQVRLRVRVVTEECEDSGQRWNGAKRFRRAFGRKRKRALELKRPGHSVDFSRANSLAAGDGHAVDAQGGRGGGGAEDEVAADGGDVLVHVLEVAGDGDLFDRVGELAVLYPEAAAPCE